MVSFRKIEEMAVDSSAFGDLVEYRHFYSSDGAGKHSPNDYDKDSERYTKGYTIARFSSARTTQKESKASAQPYHSHQKRDLFIIGVKGKRTMIVSNRKYEIVPGTYIFIEPGERHKTLNVGKQSWENIEIWRARAKDDEKFYEPVPRGFEPGRNSNGVHEK